MTFAVAMSRRANIKDDMRTELQAIATDPDSENMIDVSFDQLYLVVEKIEKFICENSELSHALCNR